VQAAGCDRIGEVFDLGLKLPDPLAVAGHLAALLAQDAARGADDALAHLSVAQVGLDAGKQAGLDLKATQARVGRASRGAAVDPSGAGVVPPVGDHVTGSAARTAQQAAEQVGALATRSTGARSREASLDALADAVRALALAGLHSLPKLIRHDAKSLGAVLDPIAAGVEYLAALIRVDGTADPA
jgi:hypothetical protein